MDIERIASVLGKTQTHVKVLLFRARNKMAEELEPARTPMVLAAKGANL
jgi:DNA-directed RNA polymerase specialized sigma24 family protein